MSDIAVIFISIDDTEVHNLQMLGNATFEGENFIANIVWQKKQSPQRDATYLSDMHDHILVYAKQAKNGSTNSRGWHSETENSFDTPKPSRLIERMITPNAGLTAQHLDELRKSGIPCERFSAAESGLGLEEGNVVRVLEITKLTGNKKGGGESVDVGAFEGRSLIFVDEGHKGAGGGKDTNLDKAFMPLRNRLAEKGFAFEYSATFGQAIQASKSQELAEEYGKAILFDYSYRHFYEDGYGKDFRILNLKNPSDEFTGLLLLGNLLSFHEQRRLYRERREELKPYKLESPLWVFVGSNVNKAEQSDIITVVRFLHRFLKNESGWAVASIEKLLRATTGLQDGDGRDAFAGYYKYLKKGSAAAQEVYESVLREVFHAGAGGTLRVADIKGSDGELGLKVAGAEPYFGLIYIGDTSAFKKLLVVEAPEVVLEEDAISGGLFGDVDEKDSRINVLIGAKKFIEGWSSWRVSNMGLLNVGKSEGSQITSSLVAASA